MVKKIYIHIVLIIMFIVTSVDGQTDLEKNLKLILNPGSPHTEEYIKSYLKGYMQPFVTAFGTAISGSIYHRATVKEFPQFDIGVSVVSLTLPNDALMFNDPQNKLVPTVFGNESNPNALASGTGKNSILLPQIQINLGLISNFEVTARYLNLNIDKFGEISLMGLGVKYGFEEYVPKFPIDLSVQAMYHKFIIGDWLDSGTIGMNLQLSKELKILPIDLYGGIGFENTSMIIKTGSIPADDLLDIGDVSIDGENNFRFNFGLSWTLAFFNVHADYNFGKYNSLGFGAMIVF
jgi:hypothetical protein